MFATVQHLSAGGWWRGKSPSSPLLFWRCSRIINIIQQQSQKHSSSSVVVSSHRQLSTLLSAHNASHMYPRENTLFLNLQPIETCSFLLGLDKLLAVPGRTAYYCRKISMGTFNVYTSQRTLRIHWFQWEFVEMMLSHVTKPSPKHTLLHQALSLQTGIVCWITN